MTKEEFLKKAHSAHGDKYTYLDLPDEFVADKTVIKIVCPKHGIFEQNARSHYRKDGCKKCYFERRRKTVEQLVEEAKQIHGDTYDYSKVEYINAKTKVCIICHEHGEFWVSPTQHTTKKQGCPICSKIATKEKLYIGTEEFIRRSKIIHGNKYDYSFTNYINTHVKVTIICPKHGEFKQEPNAHLRGQGCPHCKESHLEREIRTFLNENSIKFVEQYKDEFLKGQKLDFYIPSHNTAIECQGSQHIRGKWFRESYKRSHNDNIIETDVEKYNKCVSNGVNIVYYVERPSHKAEMIKNEKFQGIYNENNTFNDKEKLLEKIKESK